MKPRFLPLATRLTRAMAWSRLCSLSRLSMYMTCSIGASKPVSSMSQTIRKAMPVSSLSGIVEIEAACRNCRPRSRPWLRLRAAVIDGELVGGVGGDHDGSLEEGDAADEVSIRFRLAVSRVAAARRGRRGWRVW